MRQRRAIWVGAGLALVGVLVTTTIGTAAVLSSDRSLWISSKPPMIGIIKSVKTTLGSGFGLVKWSAASPFPASTTS